MHDRSRKQIGVQVISEEVDEKKCFKSKDHVGHADGSFAGRERLFRMG